MQGRLSLAGSLSVGRECSTPPVGLIKSFISYEVSEGLWTAYLVRPWSMARPWKQFNGHGPQHPVGKLVVSLASGYPCLSGPALLIVFGCGWKRNKFVHFLSCIKIG